MQHFIRKHPVRSILLTLLAAYGLWWLGNDIALRTYPQRVAHTIPVPSGAELVDTETFYSQKCKTSHIEQYYTTNEPWNIIIRYYTDQLQKDWQTTGELEFYQKTSEYGTLHFILHSIDVDSDGKPNDPSLKQMVFKGSTSYLILIAYNQDMRVFNPSGVCEPKD